MAPRLIFHLTIILSISWVLSCPANQVDVSSKCESCSQIPGCYSCTSLNSTDCQLCLPGYYQTKDKSCQKCSCGCLSCSKFIEDDPNSYCDVCYGTFPDEKGNCLPQNLCDDSCLFCSSSKKCILCREDLAESTFIVLPDIGKCITSCDSPNIKGTRKGFNDVEYLDVQTCTFVPLATPFKTPTITPESKGLMTISGICKSSFTEDADLRREQMIGAALIISKGGEGTSTLDLKTFKAELGQAMGVSVDQIGNKNLIYNGYQRSLIFIKGTEMNDPSIENVKIFKGDNVMDYICFNSLNISSTALKSKISNPDQSKNKKGNIRVLYNITLNDEQLNNLTCQIAEKLSLKGETLKFLKNPNNQFCNQTQNRKLTSISNSYSDLTFVLEPNEIDETWDNKLTGKNLEVKDVLFNYASSLNSAVELDPVILTKNETEFESAVKPALNVTVTNVTTSSISFLIESSQSSIVYYTLLVATETIEDEILRKFSTKKLLSQPGSFRVIFEQLKSNSNYTLWCLSENLLDSTKNATADKAIINTLKENPQNTQNKFGMINKISLISLILLFFGVFF